MTEQESLARGRCIADPYYVGAPTFGEVQPVVCPKCLGTLYVCEDHPEHPWAPVAGGEACCGGAGRPCPDCTDGQTFNHRALPEPEAQPELPKEIKRQLARHFEREALKPKPLASSHNGRVLTATSGAQYVRMNGGLRRVVFAEDGVHTIKKWSKARRRAEKRKRTREGASETHAQPSAE